MKNNSFISQELPAYSCSQGICHAPGRTQDTVRLACVWQCSSCSFLHKGANTGPADVLSLLRACPALQEYLPISRDLLLLLSL